MRLFVRFHSFPTWIICNSTIGKAQILEEKGLGGMRLMHRSVPYVKNMGIIIAHLEKQVHVL
jgi:hypothetical protein